MYNPYEVAVSIIQEYIDDNLFEPNANWPEYEFKNRCYERWAAEELITRITDESLILPDHVSGKRQKSPFRVIEKFIDEMDYHATRTDNQHHRFIFSIARDTAIDIIILFV